METMIVTGGAGFIGANFVRYALDHTDARVVVIDKLTYAGNLCSIDDLNGNPRFVFIRADIADREAVQSVFNIYEPDSVVNFAAETHVDRSIDDPKPFIDTNVSGAFELLEASRKHAAKLDERARDRFRFLHVSTDEVYGTLGEVGLFSETTPYAPNSPYSASKAAADHLVRAYYETYRLPTIITNCSNNYGPYQFPEKLIPLTLLNALDGKPLPIYGDGGNIRDWLYVEDHCSGIMLALRKGTPGEKYNIGGTNERTNLQVVDRICEALDRMVPAAKNPAMISLGLSSYAELKTFVKDRPGHDRRYAIDANKIRTELGWKPGHDFESGIVNTVRWYLDNRAWCAAVQEGKYGRQRLGLSVEEVGVA
ncbi:MAG TPA: dTDP-glucose 4,6-dehydratase [Blastocatellia bacterium]|nr:dTDP-glucose 4,6-dehydratase [Blastocatellia bacterium]